MNSTGASSCKECPAGQAAMCSQLDHSSSFLGSWLVPRTSFSNEQTGCRTWIVELPKAPLGNASRSTPYPFLRSPAGMLDDHKVETTATVRLAPGYYADDKENTKCTKCHAGSYNYEPGAEQEMGVPMKNLCNQLGVQRFLTSMP